MITAGKRNRSPFESLGSHRIRNSRRGITLLFTIGLITMFVLLGTTFLVVSAQYFRASRTYNLAVVQRESPRDLERTVLYNLIRGTNDRQSSVRYHDLGSDMYDRDNSFIATVGEAYLANSGNRQFDVPAPGPGAGLMAIRLNENAASLKGNPFTLSATTAAYSGQYMTFLDGPLRGETVKIVDYMVHVDPNVNVGSAGPQNLVKQFIIRPESRNNAFVNLSANPTLSVANQLSGSRVLVNSRPFNGRGAGLVGLQPVNQPQLQLDALLPNRRDYFRTTVPAPFVRVSPRDSDVFYDGVGHTNESYDAVDYQNMILAAMITDTGGLRIIPSFHRPSLVTFWDQNSSKAGIPGILANPNNNDPSNYAPFHPQDQQSWDHNARFFPLSYREFRRQVIMRPMPWDHPNFTGSNPFFVAGGWQPGPDGQPGIANYDDDKNGVRDDPGELGAEGSDDVLTNDGALLQALVGIHTLPGPLRGTYTYQTWDVDNDGDLIPDSIWVDVGLPIQVDEKGRYYKPLAAVLCTDLDGRFNLNANSSTWHQDGEFQRFVNSYQMRPPTQSLPKPPLTSDLRMRGQGYGPGEISLRPLFWDNGRNRVFQNAEFRSLLFGASFGTVPPSPNRQLDAELGLSGRYGPDADITAGLNVAPVPGRFDLDALMFSKIYELPPLTLGGSYGSYADLKGRFSTGVDINGNPVFDETNVTDQEPANSIYEMDLSSDSSRGNTAGVRAADQPFSPGELEAVLRRFDRSRGALPDRLIGLSPTLRNSPNNERLLVTTNSYDVPVPHESMLDANSIVLELRSRLNQYYGALRSDGEGVVEAEETVNEMIRYLLAHELVLGNRMNINRPFGNGQDDNQNGVIDEHWSNWDPDTSAWDLNGNAPWAVNEAFEGIHPRDPMPRTVRPEHFPGSITPFDHDNNGLAGGRDLDKGFLARQIYARHLYVLMSLLIDPGTEMDFDGDGTVSASETPYALAQLAINITDFRDADAIRTPFEFDLDPFDGNGWFVDSNIATDEGQSIRGLVWGVERPELLITETFATHDRRTEDLDMDNRLNAEREPDSDMDQRFRPEGALFIELYNPWSLSTAPNVELNETLRSANPRQGINLSQLDYFSGSTPVWRIMIAQPDGDPKTSNSWELTQGAPFLDPDPIANNPPGLQMANSRIERTIYFTQTLPTGNPDFVAISGARTYQPDLIIPNMVVPPLGYAVLGPKGREENGEYVTPFGQRIDVDEAAQDFKYEETRSIWLNPGVSVRRIQPSLNDPTEMHIVERPAIAIPMPYLSVSEPTTSDPFAPNPLDPYSRDGERSIGKEVIYEPTVDQPFDDAPDSPISPRGDWPDGTHRGFRIAHLQRLANPLLPFDRITNPYLTVDSAHIDLTIFHGVEGNPNPKLADPIGNTPRLGITEFATSERGNSEVVNDSGPVTHRNLWAAETEWFDVVENKNPAADDHVFNFHLFESLGGLNNCWQPNEEPGSPNDLYVGPRNLENPLARGPAYARWGIAPDSASPVGFPWFTFNNRPFVSQYELTLVPKSRSSQVLQEFGPLNDGINNNNYQFNADTARYGHLANFFRATGNGNNQLAPNLYRLFDFTHVPSKFVQAEQFQLAARYQNLQVGISGTSRTDTIGALPLNTPFHYVTERREPGKINLNTVFDYRVWNGILGNLDRTRGNTSYGWPGPDWEEFVASRRGYDSSAQDILGQNTGSSNPGPIPTFFANPFRDGGGGNLVVDNTPMRPLPGVQSTLFRSNLGSNFPFLDSGEAATSQVFNDARRSPYFKEVTRNRLANLVTTRSNVYAIWITVGYFEFDPRTQQLGQELGVDTGKVIRNRMFAIVDRSIPVGLQPGENNNVDNAILVERFIE